MYLAFWMLAKANEAFKRVLWELLWVYIINTPTDSAWKLFLYVENYADSGAELWVSAWQLSSNIIAGIMHKGGDWIVYLLIF